MNHPSRVPTDERSRRILITGGSGFVGRALMAELAGQGARIVATTTRDVPPAVHGVEWLRWNGVEDTVPLVLQDQFSAIVHLAPSPHSTDDAQFSLNVAATFHLLETARRFGTRFVFASTGDVLGAREAAVETDITYEPSSIYGAAKACGELLVRAFESTASACVVRLYHPYGTGGDRYLINRLVRRVANGEGIDIEGPHGIRVNPVWIDDAASGLRLLLESDMGGIFHLAGPEIVTIRELVELTGELLGVAPRVISKPCLGTERHVGAYDRARSLGYVPKTRLREGLRRLIDQM